MDAARVSTIGAEVARSEKELNRQAEQEALVRRQFKGQWPVPAYRGMMRADIAAVRRDIHRMPAEETVVDGEGVSVPHDQEALHGHLGRIAALRAKLQLLSTARPPHKVERQGSTARLPRAHTRAEPKRRGAENRQTLERLVDAEMDRQTQETGDYVGGNELLRQRAFIRKQVIAANPDLKPIKPSQAKRIAVVPNRPAVDAKPSAMPKVVTRRATRVRVQGTPDDAGLKSMRAEMSARIGPWSARRRWDAFARHSATMVEANHAFRAARRDILGNTTLLTRLGRRGAIVAAAVLGAASAAGAAHLAFSDGPERSLGKAASAADSLSEHGRRAEASIAERFAHVFRVWKDDVATNLLHHAVNLRDEFSRDIGHALAPISDAMRRGAAIPPEGGDGSHKRTLRFTMQSRGNLVEGYLDHYRDSRIAELTDEQVEAVKQTLLTSAKRGASPDQMARDIRQTVGLTATQGQSVLNFREELRSLDPAALQRALRDSRYDRTLERAIETKKPLSDVQVDSMVDAYHRRYLAYRAMTIARTEGVSAANNGHMASVHDMLRHTPGFTVEKTWIATDDERTRDDHRGLHGQTVIGFDTPFVAPSGDHIRWPGDPRAPARQVILCRCTTATRLIPIQEDQDGQR